MRYVVSVGGGPDTLQTVRDALVAGTVVVLVAGYGGVTDILAFAVRHTCPAPQAPSLASDSFSTLKSSFKWFRQKCVTHLVWIFVRKFIS